ncbi:MAG TPA: hypothetical protein VMT72_04320 [Pseudolabrys sp.]|nr:hypothetical protein [Pseudolabrys sp.]
MIGLIKLFGQLAVLFLQVSMQIVGLGLKGLAWLLGLARAQSVWLTCSAGVPLQCA